MKEGMSVTYIFQIVILFILLFTGIMALTINNTNAFAVKDYIVNYIEQHDGVFTEVDGTLSSGLVTLINSTSYRNKGNCPDDYVGYDRNGRVVSSSSNAAVCIRAINTQDGMTNYLDKFLGKGNYYYEGQYDGTYYQVIVFYQLDIPVVKQIFKFQTKGETRIIYNS